MFTNCGEDEEEEEVNQAPILDEAIFSLAENSEVGTLVGTLTATDPDGDALTYAIIGGNTSNTFNLDSLTAELKVSDSTALDYETTQIFSLEIEVSDGLLSDTGSVVINILDVDEVEEEEEEETTPITTGLSENQDLLIGSWDGVESDEDQMVANMGTSVFSFDSDNSVERAETWIDDDLVRILDGNWSFDESDPSGMTLNLFYTKSIYQNLERNVNNPYTESSTDTTILTIKTISDKRMSAIENRKIGGITLEFTFNIELIKQ